MNVAQWSLLEEAMNVEERTIIEETKEGNPLIYSTEELTPREIRDASQSKSDVYLCV